MSKVSPSEGSIVGTADRILVTGAAGFIGARVVDALLEPGFSKPPLPRAPLEPRFSVWTHVAAKFSVKPNMRPLAVTIGCR